MKTPDWVTAKPIIKSLTGELDPSIAKRVASGEWPGWLIAESYNRMLNSRFETVTGQNAGHDMKATYHALSMLKVFWYQGEKVYKIAREFGEVLLRADCRVSVDYIPFDNVVRCVEFPDDKVFDMKNGDWARTAYIAAFGHETEVRQSPEVDSPQGFSKRIDIIVPLFNESNPSGSVATDQIRILFFKEETLEQAIERAIKNTTSPTGFSRELVEYLLKCLLYIHSGDPDLREFKPQRRPHSPKKQARWLRENICPIPITLVGFDYKKPREMRADEAFVQTHLRWQPFGPNRSKVKLIWVKEHIRNYRKE